MRTFEDFFPGLIIDLGRYEVSEQEMIAFAERYDPQFFHTDPVAAADSPYGGLIGSGWLTAAIFQRMQCDSFLNDSSCVGSPGVDEIRWIKPLRPGDQLHGSNVVEAVKPSASKPDRGAVFSQVELFNQNETLVMSLRTRVIYMKNATEISNPAND
ncbi:MAG: MaoC family dehydratase [Pseudomonadota bacterium]